MNINNTFLARSALLSLALGIGLSNVSASVLTDPTRFTGTDSIDPVGYAELNATATNADSKTSVEAVSTFGVVQSFTGFTGRSANTWDDFISFTDTALPDIAFKTNSTLTSTNDNGEAGSGNATLGTSSDAYIFTRNNTNSGNTRSWIYDIDFGSYNTGSGAFTTNVNSVSAAAFTLSDLGLDGLSAAQTASAIFFNDAGDTLSTQTLTGSGSIVNGLFAHIATGGESIGSIRLTANFGAGSGSSQNFGFDDFGFTAAAIPEPSTYAMIFGILAVVAAAIRRRRS